MFWSSSECGRIVTDFWHRGGSQCPRDSMPLKVKLHRLIGGDYALAANCPSCGEGRHFRRADDPLRGQFRRWSSPEIADLTSAVVKSGLAACPVCAWRVEWRSLFPEITGEIVIQCLRCGNSSFWHHCQRLIARSQRSARAAADNKAPDALHPIAPAPVAPNADAATAQ